MSLSTSWSLHGVRTWALGREYTSLDSATAALASALTREIRVRGGDRARESVGAVDGGAKLLEVGA
jgi:hypothetical protein